MSDACSAPSSFAPVSDACSDPYIEWGIRTLSANVTEAVLEDLKQQIVDLKAENTALKARTCVSNSDGRRFGMRSGSGGRSGGSNGGGVKNIV